jgi:hypothetical protein
MSATLPKTRDYTAGNRIGKLDTLPAIRLEQSRLYRATWAKKVPSNDAKDLVYMLDKTRRTLVDIAELELREREVAAREQMAKHLAKIASDPARYLRPPINIKVEVIDNTEPARACVIDGEATETVEVLEFTGPKLQ